ncbi:Ig-like domain-containing protein [Alteromonas sp. 1_MG-2023]|uniref:Ig-like domain-containing protein n=1 Tax=Alteromonas sp. 1_MG-2023 TaxID=3062669 RepID=UPI0026E41F3A|nr:Ig-like domain-containing protein [Alteromonas sp. 1_MG-2023]MDO6476780.1 Ig-like domain-containing protein [Alteromonas sp. 1_MG-2023]
MMKHLFLVAVTGIILSGCSDDDDTNYAPEVISEDFTTTVDTSFSDTLTASDANGDTLVYSLDGSPANGSVEVADNGSFTFTPDAEFTGEDSFTFTVSDGVNDPVSGTIGIIVEAENVMVSTYVRSAFSQPATGTPLPVNGRVFENDSDDPAAFDDLLTDY